MSQGRHQRRNRCAERDQPIAYRWPAAAAGRADFYLLRSGRYVVLTPVTSRGAWFLNNTPLADPAALIPRIGPARLLSADYAAALLPALAEHFRLRYCPRPQDAKPSAQRPTPIPPSRSASPAPDPLPPSIHCPPPPRADVQP